MDKTDFGTWSHAAADWSTQYINTVADKPVRSMVSPGDIQAKIASSPPEQAEDMQAIFDDFEAIIPDGMTHWQHPRFFAYFPSNAAPAAIIAEQLAGAMSINGMLWQTSPSATELETCMMDWLRQAVGLPDSFSGVMQDTASTATLCAVLTMRELALDRKGNQEGLFNKKPVRIYASARTHTSIDKALWVAGLGQDNLVKISTNSDYALDINALKQAIVDDRAEGLLPGGIVVCVGGTSMGACDHVREICELAQQEGLYTHVDAAWAGSAMICPEFRYLWDGIELADSIVLNPHKWLGASLECSAHFVREPDKLINTMSIRPDYLKTHAHDDVTNYSEWSVQLGRRFRALKVWFLLRAYGLEGLRTRIRNHIEWSCNLAEQLRVEDDFEIVTDPILSLFTFRLAPQGYSPDQLDALNLELVNIINNDGRIYLTQSVHDGIGVIRFTAGQFDMQESDIHIAYQVIVELAGSLLNKQSS